MKNIQMLPAVHQILCDRIIGKSVSPTYYKAAMIVINRLEKQAEEWNKQFVWDSTGQNLIKKQA